MNEDSVHCSQGSVDCVQASGASRLFSGVSKLFLPCSQRSVDCSLWSVDCSQWSVDWSHGPLVQYYPVLVDCSQGLMGQQTALCSQTSIDIQTEYLYVLYHCACPVSCCHQIFIDRMGIIGITSYFSDLEPLAIDFSAQKIQELTPVLLLMLNHKTFQFLSSRWHASGTKVAKSGTY